MSRQYDTYLTLHKANVRKGFYWIREHLPELIPSADPHNLEDIEHQICFAHDASKTEQDEYGPYDAYFYGGNRSYAVVQEFNHAWLRHQHRNPHHWQYWILHHDNSDEGVTILDMPMVYIIEMICDWWAFSWSKGNLREIFSWYDDHKDYMKLSDKTRKEVESILEAIKNKLDELWEEAGNENK